MFISKIYIQVSCLTVRAGSMLSTLCSGLLWCHPCRHRSSAPTLGVLSSLGEFSDVPQDGALESWACRLQARKIDYFDHKRCICMNEFLIVAKSVKSGSTKQSKEMDLSPQLQLMVSVPSGKSMSTNSDFLIKHWQALTALKLQIL